MTNTEGGVLYLGVEANGVFFGAFFLYVSRETIENWKRCEKEVMEKLQEQYEFRNIKQEEIPQAAEIEKRCFPPNEACSYEHMEKRVRKAPELFLVAVDKETGLLAGFLNGLATEKEHLTDDFFTDAEVHNPAGKNIMLLGLDVLPEHRGKGLARALVEEYIRREREKGREKLILTCVDDKVEMYKKFGFIDHGIGISQWGGEAWHEMSIVIK